MTNDKKDLLKQVIVQVIAEATEAASIYPEFNSPHEGYAVLLEEVDELWEAVRLKQTDNSRIPQMRKEAIQVGAMAMRFLMMLETENGKR